MVRPQASFIRYNIIVHDTINKRNVTSCFRFRGNLAAEFYNVPLIQWNREALVMEVILLGLPELYNPTSLLSSSRINHFTRNI